MSRFAVFLVGLTILYGQANAGGPGITSGNTATLPENTTVGTEVVTVTTEGMPIAVVTIESQTPNSMPHKFNITNNAVVLQAMLDFENATSYTLMIKAMDSMDNTSSAMQTMTITVTDVNEPPVFMQMSYKADVDKNKMANETVTTVTAMDPDAGNTLTYDIDVNGNTNMDFKINNMGVVMTNKMIDGNPMTYTLRILAKDNQMPSLTGTATLSITVKNAGVNVMAGVLCTLMPLIYFFIF